MHSMSKKIAIFIPTHNAAYTLPYVIDRIPQSIKTKVKEIFVIDNASDDNTYLVGVGYKEETGLSNLQIFKNEKNVGYGGSQKLAYNYVIDNGFDIVVMLHGDAQYSPEFIPQLLAPVEKGEADMVFGSRMKGNPLAGGMPLYRLLGNRLLTWIENLILDMNLSEFHSGFRVFNVNSLEKLPFMHCSDDYLFDTEILIQFRLNGFKIKEVPIPTHYGEESHSPTFYQLIKYSLYILKSLYEYSLHKRSIKRFEKFKRASPLEHKEDNLQ